MQIHNLTSVCTELYNQNLPGKSFFFLLDLSEDFGQDA